MTTLFSALDWRAMSQQERDLGLNPTMPQKLAGLRKLPPMSEPCASHAVPVASATAAPPEEPAAERDVSQGLRVAPNTSLNVLAPAPNSGVFDLA